MSRAARSSLSRRSLLGAGVGVALTARLGRVARADPDAPAPVLYVSHGAPLFGAADPSRIRELTAWGARLAKPRGIVVMTPHFAARHAELGATGTGFAMYNLPPALKRRLPPDLEYATPPSESLATRIEAILGGRIARPERRGFDHTTWMPLKCLFPAADVSVLEISYPYVTDAALFALGRRLAPLRDEGILFLASGGMTHNLASVTLGGTAAPPAWSVEFDAWAAGELAKRSVDALVDWRRKAPASSLAHPDDGAHYRVLLVALGVALGAKTAAREAAFPVTGFEDTLSKRCVELT